MAGWNRPKVTERIAADQKIWLISDLHLGDGTPSDAFFGKDRHLMALVETVDREGGVLVVGGDAMDFLQAWSFTRILRAHHELLSAMSRIAREGRLYYIIGNHDYDISLYREMLQFRVCDELLIGDDILVTHGYEYDPYHANKDLTSQFGTQVHHLVERYLNTWIRIPLGEFYTLGNRLVFWAAHKAALVARAWTTTMSWLGFPRSAEKLEAELNFWARSNMGDPMCMFDNIMDQVDNGRYRFVVCGHSHLPGVVRSGDRAYVNTGSWTFASSHFCFWDGQDFSCHDWLTGREIREEFYRPILDGALQDRDFWTWWRENYMGFLRFREGEERKGRLRGWESYVRDHQYLAQLPTGTLRPLAPPPRPEARIGGDGDDDGDDPSDDDRPDAVETADEEAGAAGTPLESGSADGSHDERATTSA